MHRIRLLENWVEAGAKYIIINYLFHILFPTDTHTPHTHTINQKRYPPKGDAMKKQKQCKIVGQQFSERT